MSAVSNNIEPIWASEIDKFSIEITKKHFPNMVHVGDICKLNGEELQPVDIVSGGSPCQDLSIAGMRMGLDGERSNLFMEQIRIVKEMRNAGGTNESIRPRYMLWENVPGSFSSNRGEDFRKILEEICRIKEESISIPKPPDGKWLSVGSILGEDYSIAWRVLDAKYWGVPQRRKRIFLIADFGGNSAGEILFDTKRVYGNFKKEQKERNKSTTNSEKFFNNTRKKHMIIDSRKSIVYKDKEVFPTLTTRSGRLLLFDQTERIRRLTPLECERLMGYPDGWTKIEGASDTVRYKALGNSVAIPCTNFLFEKITNYINQRSEVNENGIYSSKI